MISGIIARDYIENKSYKIMSKGVINATGVFSDSITNLDIKKRNRTIVPSQGVHIVSKQFKRSNLFSSPNNIY